MPPYLQLHHGCIVEIQVVSLIVTFSSPLCCSSGAIDWIFIKYLIEALLPNPATNFTCFSFLNIPKV